MTFTEQFVDQLQREGARTRRVLAEVPHDRDDWTPHPKSMPLARLAGLVASMPSWFNLILETDELDLTPQPGSSQYAQPATHALVAALDGMLAKANDAFARTNDAFLSTTNWRLRANGQVVSDEPRLVVVRDTFSHWAHHRGQLTVYLRLTGRPVPSVYGPSADDQTYR